jgi:hypothetical protein
MPHWFESSEEWKTLLSHCKSCSDPDCSCSLFVKQFGAGSKRLPVCGDDDATDNTWLWFTFNKYGRFRWQCIFCHRDEQFDSDDVAKPCQISNLLTHQTSTNHARLVEQELGESSTSSAISYTAPSSTAFKELLAAFQKGDAVQGAQKGFDLKSGIIGQHKAEAMLWCLSQARDDDKREAIALFCQNRVRTSSETANLIKKSTIDICITIGTRLFTLEGIEELIAADERVHGQQSFWNILYRLQEFVSRFQKSSLMTWAAHSIMDKLKSGELKMEELSVAALRSGPKSISDVIAVQCENKIYLLGKWLTTQPYPDHVKCKAREVFASHASYRASWSPHFSDDQTQVDTTWLLHNPKAVKDLFNFLESAIYFPTHAIEHAYRNAVKNNCSAPELLTQSPFKERLAEIDTAFKLTAVPETIADNAAQQGNAAAAAGGEAKKDELTPAEKLEKSSDKLVTATNRLMLNQCQFINDQASVPSMRQLYESTPLDTPHDCLVDTEDGLVDTEDGSIWIETLSDESQTLVRVPLDYNDADQLGEMFSRVRDRGSIKSYCIVGNVFYFRMATFAQATRVCMRLAGVHFLQGEFIYQ